MDKSNITNKNKSFDSRLPIYYASISKIHWTPALVIDEAVNWMIEHQSLNVLDIGSGVGKFCLLATQNCDINFTGVEIRAQLHKEANAQKELLNSQKVNFIHSDITKISFLDYDTLYYYHPFCEQLCEDEWIDQDLEFSKEQFETYESYVLGQLIQMKIGTKFISYGTSHVELPECYILEDIKLNGDLQLWIKKK